MPLFVAAWYADIYALALLTLFPVVYMILSGGGDLPRFSSRLGRQPALGELFIPRVLLLGALGIVAGKHGGGSLLPFLAIGLVALAMTLETGTKVIAERIQPIAVNLPGFTKPNSLRVNLSWIQLFSLAWSASFIPVLALDGVTDPLLAISTSLLVVANVVAMVWTVHTWRIQIASSKALTEALLEYTPKFVIHWEAPANTVYQVQMWLPYLEQVGVDYFILVRDTLNFGEVSAITKRPVVLRSDLKDIDSAIVSSLKAVLYFNTATLNNHLVRFTELTHIQLNHGDSDKAASSNPAFKIFSKNFVAGQAAIDRFKRNGVSTPPDFFEIVGRPQVAGILPRQQESGGHSTRTVLYAPTWHGFYEDSNYSSLSVGLQIVQGLVAAGARVIFRPHPYSYRSTKYRRIITDIEGFLSDQSTPGSLQHLYGEDTTTPDIKTLFNISDALISDVSSVIADYLHSEKPFSIVCINQSPESLAELMPVSKAAYVLNATGALSAPQSAATIVDKAKGVAKSLLDNDSLHGARHELKTYYLGAGSNGTEVEMFVSALKKYVE